MVGHPPLNPLPSREGYLLTPVTAHFLKSLTGEDACLSVQCGRSTH